jgi:hypothetical protein
LFWGAAIPEDIPHTQRPGTCAGMRRLPVGGSVRPDYGVRSHRSSIPSRVLPKSAGRCIAGMMETHAELKERVRRDQQPSRLDLGLDQDPAPRHGTQAQRDRIRAGVVPHQLGLSIRQIRPATGPSPSRDPAPQARRKPARSPVAAAGPWTNHPHPGGDPVRGRLPGTLVAHLASDPVIRDIEWPLLSRQTATQNRKIFFKLEDPG